MPAVVDQIMTRARAIRRQILAEIEAASPAEVMTKPAPDRWSARDVAIHLGNWEAEAVAWFHLLLKGKPLPTTGYEDIDKWNAEHQVPYAHLDMAGALDYLASTRRDLEAVVAQVTEEHLASNPSFQALLLMTPDHEAGHLYQIREAIALARGDHHGAARHGLGYARERVLLQANLEFRNAAAWEWKPGPEKWSVREILVHLAAWDWYWAGHLQALAENRELPPQPWAVSSVDEWNKQMVAAGTYRTLADTLHELGAARGALEVQLARLSPAQIAGPQVQEWLKALREHDDHHMHTMLDRRRASRAAGK
jgi:hypothetical protein